MPKAYYKMEFLWHHKTQCCFQCMRAWRNLVALMENMIT